MRNFLTIFSIVLFISCSSMPYVYQNIQINEDELRHHVNSLVQTPEPRNFINIESLNMAAGYIDSVFRKYCNRIVTEPFMVEGNEYKNIICSFGPDDGPRIIIGAHYDVCENQPGADDNASGIAGLLELARLFNLHATQLENRIDLVAFTLEEPPFFRTEYMGSAIHAKNLHDRGVDVKMMICLEMIGYFDERPNSQQFPVGLLSWFYPDTGNFITVVSNFKSRHIASSIKDIMEQSTRINVEKLSAPAFVPGVDFSDHQNFWKYGIKAVMITDTAFYRNPNYHRTSDSIDTLDFGKMSEVIKGIYYAVIHSGSYL
jgi:Zn-dependent M28 family amino/carboxypeptidase